MQRVKHWDRQAVLLWPPVPLCYFVPLSQKPFSDKIHVTFLGRIDIGKGVLEAIDIFNALAECSEVKLAFYGIYWKNDPTAVQLHHQLSDQRRFSYVPIKFTNHSDQIDEMVRSVLYDTDIFIQPYRKLNSTIDTPLLILEAMASLCAVITKPYGDISHIYGKSPCLIDSHRLCEQAIRLILSAKEWLPSERERIERQNKSLLFDTTSVVERFVDALNTSTEIEGRL
jgi:glycosyltransferase involved in cell wall biosynthesis